MSFSRLPATGADDSPRHLETEIALSFSLAATYAGTDCAIDLPREVGLIGAALRNMADSHGITLRPCGASEATRWDDWVDSTKHGTLFHRWRWLDFVERYQHLTVERLVLEQNGQWIGLFPLAVRRLGPIKLAGSPLYIPATPYQGPLTEDPTDRAVYESIRGYLIRRGVHFCRISIPDKIEPRTVDPGPAFRKLARRTHVLDLLPPVESLWSKMDSARRRVLRKAEKANVKVVHAHDARYVSAYYDLQVELYRSKQLPTPHPRSFYTDILTSFPTDVQMSVAVLDDEVIAGAVTAWDRDTAYFLDGVSAKAHNTLSPNSLLQWAMIRESKSRGLLRYDFVGSDLPWLARYKAGFGAILCEYAWLEFARPGAFFAMRDAYRRARYAFPGLRRRLAELRGHADERKEE